MSSSSIQISHIFVIFLRLEYRMRIPERPDWTNRLTLHFENEYIRFNIKIFYVICNAIHFQQFFVKKE
jgi:hypothetical protein